MKYNYILFSLTLLICLCSATLGAQVNIGTTKPPVDAGLLQIRDKDIIDAGDNATVAAGGMLLPRVALQHVASLSPLTSITDIEQKAAHAGTLVYNITKDQSLDLYEGIYIWDGNAWVFMVFTADDFTLYLKNAAELPIYPSGLTGIDLSAIAHNIIAEWNPSTGRCTFTTTPIINDGVLVDGTLPLGVTGGTYTYPLKLKPMTLAEIAENPFLEKVSYINVTANDAGAFRIEKARVRQVHYNLIVDGLELEPKLGKEYTAKVRSNSRWKVHIVQGGDAIESYTGDGSPNIVIGSDFKYRFKQDYQYNGTEVIFQFVALNEDGVTEDNKFIPVLKTVTGVQEYANSYIVAPGATQEMPVTKAYDIWKEYLAADLAQTGLQAELVWQDNPTLIPATGISLIGNGPDAKIRVETNAGKEGNALVALKIGGEIRWTWHLWIINYNPNTIVSAEAGFDDPGATASANVTGGKLYGYFNGRLKNIFMDRHLGALTEKYEDGKGMGFFYQFGRHVPIINTEKMVEPAPPNGIYPSRKLYDISGASIGTWIPTDVTAEENLINAIQYPLNVYRGVVANDNDWYGTKVIENPYLWKKPNGAKGDFDPCPEGWNLMDVGTGTGTDIPFLGVPGAGQDYITDQDLDLSSFGLGFWSRTLFLLTSGFIGKMNDANTALATKNAAGAYMYYQGLGTPLRVQHIGAYDRSMGFNVRCVRDDK